MTGRECAQRLQKAARLNLTEGRVWLLGAVHTKAPPAPREATQVAAFVQPARA
jgi:hypothetical protein